jgi:hypothetical protein
MAFDPEWLRRLQPQTAPLQKALVQSQELHRAIKQSSTRYSYRPRKK